MKIKYFVVKQSKCTECDGTGFIVTPANEEETCSLCAGNGSSREEIELGQALIEMGLMEDE